MNTDDSKIKINEKIVIEKYKKITPEISKRINEVYAVDTRFFILALIANFGPSNIKEISIRLGKNKATIHHHILWLVNEEIGPPMLELDIESMKKKRGKYYKLTEISLKEFGTPNDNIKSEKVADVFREISELPDEEISKLYITMIRENPNGQNLKKHEEQKIKYNKFMENIMLNNLETSYNELNLGKQPLNTRYPLGSLSNFDFSLKVSKPKHMFKVLSKLMQIQSEISELANEIKKEMKEEKITEENQILLRYHIFGGEVANFEFQ